MSKAASTRSTPRPTVPAAVPAAEAAALIHSLAPLLHEWLPRQRWFAGKGRQVTGFVPVTVTELQSAGPDRPGLLHLLVRVEQQGAGAGHAPPRPPPSASSAPSPGDCYQLLLGLRESLPPRLAPALHRPGDAWAAGRPHGLRRPARSAPRRSAPGAAAHPGGAGAAALRPGGAVPAGLPSRLLGVEQSNSSLVYGDSYILKILRRVFPGPHPDLELPLALAAQGCERVPAPVAWFEASDPAGSGEPLTLGVLQPYLRGSQDGWQLALAALADGREFTSEARALGHATAEVHLALARRCRRSRWAAAGRRSWLHAMAERLDAAAQAVPALLPYVPGLRAAFDALAGLDEAGRGRPAQRVHGDLHLGQALRTPDGRWSVIDFEGEPARPLAERRRPQPPVRDVAGMLRSFDYAARSHKPWRADWASRCRAAFCDGYAAAAGTDPRSQPELLRAYETDKAVYEVLYEARHRPDWLPVPMAAIERLAGDRG